MDSALIQQLKLLSADLRRRAAEMVNPYSSVADEIDALFAAAGQVEDASESRLD